MAFPAADSRCRTVCLAPKRVGNLCPYFYFPHQLRAQHTPSLWRRTGATAFAFETGQRFAQLLPMVLLWQPARRYNGSLLLLLLLPAKIPRLILRRLR